ncbi:MAG TPA: AAA family ATPase [Solirubrobacteraceae bacterium]|nr:AAA family ATPase [Solirubrobacteraceae bacterium]
MYLKSITMKGFKSFPDRTRLEFGPGTSVIVGPNGSGKSNVTDAVLWALGEQSPVAIRGQTMSDVIFGGAPGRQASSAAEVELVLDDAEGRLGMGPEVSIQRRLDRAGDGEYRLAGARCRLTDVLEVLSDTGLGKEMHSVISQGRVDAIVISKPRDRRLLIEEAAGLGKHRKRRRRAQLKLGHTQDNLDRALDVEREARSRLKPLKRQAEAAELHERIHRQMLEARWELARDDARRRREELASAAAAAEQARTERERLATELGRIAARRRAAEEALAARSSRREELSRRSYAAQAAADRVGLRADSVAETLRSVDGRWERSQAQLEQLEAQAAADRPDPEAEARVTALARELQALEADREAELARQLAELETQRTEAEAELARCEAALGGTLAARTEAERALDAARQVVREADREVDAARRRSAQVGGELAAVNQFLRSHASAPGGGRALSDALAVAAGYELAVAAALDGRLSAAVAADRAEAARLLGRAGKDGGRVLIAGPGTASAAGGGSAEATSVAAQHRATSTAPLPGAVSLAEQVSGAGPAAELARGLLADVWVLDDVEALEAIDPDFPGVAVTRGGRVYAPATRELRQAAAVGEERVLAERNRQAELLAASEAAVAQEHTAKGRAQALVGQIAELDAARETAVAAHRAAVHRRDEATEHVRRLGAQIERRRRAPDEGESAGRRAQLRAELRAEHARGERLVSERAERAARIGHLRGSIERHTALVPHLLGIVEDLRELSEIIAAQRTVFDTALAADREAAEAATGALREAARAEAAQQNALNAAANALTGVEVRRQRAEDLAAEAQSQLEALAAELELAPAPAEAPLEEPARAALAERITRLQRRREQLGPVNPLAQQEYEEALEHVEELERQRTDLETALRELEKLIRDTDRQIRETFEETFSAAARNFEELAARVFPGGSGRLRLVSENDGQPRVIGGRRGEDAAGGGDGEGVDADAGAEDDGEGGQDAEQQPGVEIEITPAGKAMKRLTLLSGGEKSMTALAFLFAVFLAKPCPFYIMDEVEAALDDLNISRFLDLLDTYNDRAQFIVVTHQKRTMEAADALYGVSMGGDGISKVISRRLPAREATVQAA